MNIVVDSREKKPLFFDNVSVAKLNCGDYSLLGFEHEIAIERKGCVSEVAQNITEKRFADWTNRLCAIKYPFLVCDFYYQAISAYPPPFLRRKSRIRPGFIFKKLNEIEELGITIIYSGSREASRLKILEIFKSYIDGSIS